MTEEEKKEFEEFLEWKAEKKRKAVDTMRLAGIDAKAVKSENNNYIEYTIKIPKKTASDNKSA